MESTEGVGRSPIPPKILKQTLASPPPGGKQRGDSQCLPFSAIDPTLLKPLLHAYVKLTLHIFSPYIFGWSVPLAVWAGRSGYTAVSAVSTLLSVICCAKLLDVYAVETRPKKVKPGLFYKPTEKNERIVSKCELLNKPYKPTWWLWTGDLLTLYPFIAFNSTMPKVEYTRRWIKTADGEYIALDWAFPEGGFSPKKPVLLVAHGLNGGSQEGYCVDLVLHAQKLGYTVVVMIARGLMSTPIHKGHFFHGARISDMQETVELLATCCEGAPIVAVGFSMGALILSNYVAQLGKDCPLAAAVAVAGCFDSLKNMENAHSRVLWQPFLAYELKKNFLLPFYDYVVASGVDIDMLKKAVDVIDLDTLLVAPYNSYRDVVEYYQDMSAGCLGKEHNIAVPLLVMQAADDPIIDVDCTPIGLEKEVENIFFFVTKQGGHVGWPTGTNPNTNRWAYSSQVSLDFLDAILSTSDN